MKSNRKPRLLDFDIDKLTNSIENSISRDQFETEVLKVLSNDIGLKKSEWNFDWKKELKETDREVFKLVIKGNSDVIQGLISITENYDHVFMHLIESAKFNKGKKKLYAGVAGNLVAFACKNHLKRVMMDM